jgi:integrase/recombinase XerD
VTTETLDTLMVSFIEERQYCKNVTPATIEYYHKVWKNCRPLLPETAEELNRVVLMKLVKGLSTRGGINTVTVNIYLRGLNAFLKWLHADRALTPTLLRISLLKTEKKVMSVFSETHVDALLRYKPHHLWEKRALAIATLLIDTGARINEALTLDKENLDLPNLLVKFYGKGRKERIVPISPECRKIIYQWMKHQPHPLVFATSTGTVMSHTNSSRDFKKLCKNAGVRGVRCNWHTLRHTFGTNYISRGGDVFRLQHSLGHSDLSVTRKYVHVQTKDLSSVHSQLSLVASSGKR